MKDVLFYFSYASKIFFRNKTGVFWTVLYPLILAGLFYLGFSGIIHKEFNTIEIGVDKEYKNILILKSIDLLHVNEMDPSDMKENLLKNKISAYVKKDGSLAIKYNGGKEEIVNNILKEIKKIEYLSERGMVDFSLINKKFIKTDKVVSIYTIPFYVLIAMQSLYSMFASQHMVDSLNIKTYNIAIRHHISGMNHKAYIFASIINGILINIVANTILLIFMEYILKLDMINHFTTTLFIITIGNIFGISYGILIAMIPKLSAGIKGGLLVATSLLFSFFSGMMSVDVRMYINANFKWLAKLNPIEIISDTIYKINALNKDINVFYEMLPLLIFSISFIFISLYIISRRSYDSI